MKVKGGLNIFKKYITLIMIIFLTITAGVNYLSVSITKDNYEKSDENIDICIGNIKDGFGLTIEIYNQGDTDIKNIQLNVDVKKEKFIYIPKKTYEIPYLSAGDSTKIRVIVFGFGLGIFYDYPLITFTVNSSASKTFWKIISTSIIGVKTQIMNEISSSAESYEGYTLFGPEYSRNTYLIKNNGIIVHIWKSKYIQGLCNYLLENGDLLRLDLPGDNPTFRGGGIAGRVEKFDQDSNLLWEFEYSNSDHCAHHDIEPLPNGNVLLIAWEYKTREDAIAAGRDPRKLQGDALWPDHIVEIEPTGSSGGIIVWEWHVWDHLIQEYDPSKDNYGVVEDHPELIDINYGNHQQDWNHINSIDYNEELDQILVSVHEFDEIWVIDHSTTIEEAADHTGGNSSMGGDLLYRWGNPQAYRAGNAGDKMFFGQHGASWVDAGCPGEGNIIVFNNGQSRGYSSVDEIVPPLNSTGSYTHKPRTPYAPEEPIWIFTTDPPSDMYSMQLSNAQRLPNGNTLICSAQQGLFLEVTPDKNVVWKYSNILPTPYTNAVARIYRYPLDYPGASDLNGMKTGHIHKKL